VSSNENCRPEDIIYAKKLFSDIFFFQNWRKKYAFIYAKKVVGVRKAFWRKKFFGLKIVLA